jgi:ubiquitin-conjugating enzyme (huntingtin interacting protein 2)
MGTRMYTYVISNIYNFIYNIDLLGPAKIPDLDDKIRRLTDMGIEEHNARVALSSYNWDLERATEHCLFS